MSDSNSTIKFCDRCQTDTCRNAKGGCRPCAISYCAAWRVANHEKAKAASVAWRVKNPEKSKANSAAWLENNRDRKKATDAAWKSANHEKIKAADAVRKAVNPEALRIHKQNRRARERSADGSLSKGLAAKLFALQKGKCPCCKQPLGDNYHLDHIKPLALGGSNTDGNIQLLRQRCNNQKSAKDPIDFMQARGFLL